MQTINQLIMQYPVAFHAMIILASLAIIVKAADYLVLGITRYAEKQGISEYITGMIIVAFTASVPELISSIMGTIADEPGIVFGTIIGSNIAGLGFVLAILALVGRKINLKSRLLKRTEVLIFFISIIPFLLVADGTLSRIDGAIMILIYMGFTAMLWKKEKELGSLKKDVKLKRFYKDAILFILALFAILLSSRWLVFSAIESAKILGISPFYVSLVVIGLGASIPDLTVSVRAVLRGSSDVGIGNSFGSLLIKSLLFLGMIAMINPLHIRFNLLLTSIVFSIFISGICFYYTEKGSMNWKNGLFLLLIYIIFILIESFKVGI